MQFLFDFFPVLLFFITYYWKGIYVATGVAMVASVVQVAYSWLRHHKVEKMVWITFGLIMVFGSLTLILQDERFIKLKPTAINWLFGMAFLSSQFFSKKPLIIQRMLGEAITLPQRIWRQLNLSWGLFFMFSGVLNLYIIANYDTDTWVNFKLFGMTGLTLAFMLIQGVYLSRFMQEEPDQNSTEKDKTTEEQP